jgi:hypothetical protein
MDLELNEPTTTSMGTVPLGTGRRETTAVELEVLQFGTAA